MRHYERYFNAEDSTRLFAQSWMPSAPPRAFVVIQHGIAEHSGRYAHVAEYLVGHGIAVGAFDLRGHGRSGGRRAYIKRFTQITSDLAVYLEASVDERREAPLFLLGHDLGGAVIAASAVNSEPVFCGLIFSSPALRFNDDVSPLLPRAWRIAGWVLPILPTVRIDPSTISRDPRAVAAYRADPLVYHGRTPARTGAELVSSMRLLLEAAPRITLPILLLHGTEDRIWDPDGSILFYELSKSPDKTLKIYTGFYHETLNEPEKERVLSDVVEWIDEKLEEIGEDRYVTTFGET